MLYIVATPIGNLADMSFRALETFRNADFILCEDTRHSLKLLSYYKIEGKKLISYFGPKENEKIPKIISYLKNKTGVLITDGGTPCISDPGYKLVQACYDNKIDVFTIPGPSAVTAAIALSGFSADTFVFVGFLPRKKSKIIKVFTEYKSINGLIVLYESPYRVISTLEIIKHIFGDCHIFVVREITKLYEQKIKGKVSEILRQLTDTLIKGEFVIIIENYKKR